MDFREFLAHRKGFVLAMEIYKISKKIPKEEKYSLSDQIHRFSRSVCSNFAEAYRKRNYPKLFASKLTYSDGEYSETLIWLEFALACKYIEKEIFQALEEKNKEIGKVISYMISNPGKFGSHRLTKLITVTDR